MQFPKNPFPSTRAPEVVQMKERLLSLSATGSEYHLFLRRYFGNSLTRIAMNIVMLRQFFSNETRHLDVGSFGLEQLVLKKEFPGSSYDAVNLEGGILSIRPEGFCVEFEESAGALWMRQVDVEKDRLPFPDNSFNLITCFEVLEHLKYNPVHMLKEIKRVLVPDGFCILTTPNINSTEALLRMLNGESPQECPFFFRSAEHGVIHPKEYTVQQVRNLFESLGFEIMLVESVETDVKVYKKFYLTGYFVRLFLLLLRIYNRKVRKSYYPGKNIIAFVRKGGDIVDEFPICVYDS